MYTSDGNETLVEIVWEERRSRIVIDDETMASLLNQGVEMVELKKVFRESTGEDGVMT